jgi:hypothetical protein
VVSDTPALAARLNTAWLDVEAPISLTREVMHGDRPTV